MDARKEGRAIVSTAWVQMSEALEATRVVCNQTKRHKIGSDPSEGIGGPAA
jgi:hypothetical protein